MRSVAYLLFFASGVTALIYQVVWMRSLSLVFGASHTAASIVLAAYMGGLALGGFLLGRRAERTNRPLRLYGFLEIGVALFALALPLLLDLVQSLYVAAAKDSGDVGPGLNAVRTLLAFAVLLLPTFFMGGTLPALVRFSGGRLPGLYALNTAGAVLGVLAAGPIEFVATRVEQIQAEQRDDVAVGPVRIAPAQYQHEQELVVENDQQRRQEGHPEDVSLAERVRERQ